MDIKKEQEKIIKVLESVRNSNARVRIWYGNPETGVYWLEVSDVTGYVSRSTGTKPVYILVHNSRSFGGGAILVDSIVRIDEIATHRTRYKSPIFKTMDFDIVATGEAEYPYRVATEGSHIFAAKSFSEAKHFIQFQNGARYRL